MFQREQTIEDYLPEGESEEDEEEDVSGSGDNKMSKATIGALGGIFTLISAFAFYKASR